MNCRKCLEQCNCCSHKNTNVCATCRPFGRSFHKSYRTSSKCPNIGRKPICRFKAGDIATIKRNLFKNDAYNGCLITDNMVYMAGKQVEILNAYPSGRYVISGSEWFWDDEMFE